MIKIPDVSNKVAKTQDSVQGLGHKAAKKKPGGTAGFSDILLHIKLVPGGPISATPLPPAENGNIPQPQDGKTPNPTLPLQTGVDTVAPQPVNIENTNVKQRATSEVPLLEDNEESTLLDGAGALLPSPALPQPIVPQIDVQATQQNVADVKVDAGAIADEITKEITAATDIAAQQAAIDATEAAAAMSKEVILIEGKKNAAASLAKDIASALSEANRPTTSTNADAAENQPASPRAFGKDARTTRSDNQRDDNQQNRNASAGQELLADIRQQLEAQQNQNLNDASLDEFARKTEAELANIDISAMSGEALQPQAATTSTATATNTATDATALAARAGQPTAAQMARGMAMPNPLGGNSWVSNGAARLVLADPTLGPLSISVTERNNGLVAKISGSRPMTMQALEQALPELLMALGGGGMQVKSLTLSGPKKTIDDSKPRSSTDTDRERSNSIMGFLQDLL